MDMWPAYINRMKQWCPGPRILFYLFRLVKEFNKVIDKVRNPEYRKACAEDKQVIKGSKYLLLKNKENLRAEERSHLKQLLRLNEKLSTLYILKDASNKIWSYRPAARAKKTLDRWCSIAYESDIPQLHVFANRLKAHEYGILNHRLYPVSTGKLERMNNKSNLPIEMPADSMTKLIYMRSNRPSPDQLDWRSSNVLNCSNSSRLCPVQWR